MSLLLNIIDAANGTLFKLAYSYDNINNIYINDVKKEIESINNKYTKSDQIIYIKTTMRIYHDEDRLSNITDSFILEDNNDIKVCHLNVMMINNSTAEQYVKSSSTSVILDPWNITGVDELSLTAAAAWMDQCKQDTNAAVPNGVLHSKNKLNDVSRSIAILTQYTQLKSHIDQPNDVAINARNLPVLEFNWFDWRVLSRYVVCFLLFAQSSSYTRMAIFLSLSLLYYAIEVGMIALLMQGILQDEEANNNQGAVERGGNAIDNNNGNVAAAAAADVRGANDNDRSILSQLLQLSRNGIRLPVIPGFGYDIATFFMSFFLSLMPHWSVA